MLQHETVKANPELGLRSYTYTRLGLQVNWTKTGPPASKHRP